MREPSAAEELVRLRGRAIAAADAVPEGEVLAVVIVEVAVMDGVVTSAVQKAGPEEVNLQKVSPIQAAAAPGREC
jgi:hypothetical protein